MSEPDAMYVLLNTLRDSSGSGDGSTGGSVVPPAAATYLTENDSISVARVWIPASAEITQAIRTQDEII